MAATSLAREFASARAGKEVRNFKENCERKRGFGSHLSQHAQPPKRCLGKKAITASSPAAAWTALLELLPEEMQHMLSDVCGMSW
jgi:hypothetical protein